MAENEGNARTPGGSLERAKQQKKVGKKKKREDAKSTASRSSQVKKPWRTGLVEAIAFKPRGRGTRRKNH